MSDHPPKTQTRAKGAAKAGSRARPRQAADAPVVVRATPAVKLDGSRAVGDPQAQPRFYRPAAYDVEDSVGFLMKKVMMSIVAQADKRLGEHGLTNSQWSPLMRMRLSGACTVAELARWLQTDAGATTRLLDRLEKKGLCQRTRCTEDRRVVRVALTPEGEAAIAEVPAVMSAIMNEHLAGFSEAEWRLMLSLLRRMLRNGEALRDTD